MAELRELQADSGAALEAWSKAVSKSPGNAQYLARQGYWLSQGGRLDEAEVALTKANKKRNDPATTAELGFVKYRKEQEGRGDEAAALGGEGEARPARGPLLPGHRALSEERPRPPRAPSTSPPTRWQAPTPAP